MSPRPRQRRISGPRPVRGLARGRHGRGQRSSVAGPFLPMLTGRVPRFELAVAEAIELVRARLPERFEGVRVEVAGMPGEVHHPGEGMDRWSIEAPDRIVFYRVPIDRLAKLHCDDPVHYRVHVERIVMEGFGELFDVDPWSFLPEEYDD